MNLDELTTIRLAVVVLAEKYEELSRQGVSTWRNVGTLQRVSPELPGTIPELISLDCAELARKTD